MFLFTYKYIVKKQLYLYSILTRLTIIKWYFELATKEAIKLFIKIITIAYYISIIDFFVFFFNKQIIIIIILRIKIIWNYYI